MGIDKKTSKTNSRLKSKSYNEIQGSPGKRGGRQIGTWILWGA